MTTEELVDRILNRIGIIAYSKVRPAIRSRTLAEALHVVREADQAILTIPHYWAVYVHDGHAAFVPRRDRGLSYLAWFRNALDDPRLLNGGGPERYADVKFLRDVWDREQFVDALFSGKLVLARRAPDTRPGEQFYTKPLTGLGQDEEVATVVADAFSAFLIEYFPSEHAEAHGRI